MNLETKITIYKFTPQLFTLTLYGTDVFHSVRKKLLPTAMISLPKTVSLPMPTTTSNNPYMPHLLTIQDPSAIGN